VGIGIVAAPADGIELLPYHADELSLIVPRRHALARKRKVALADTLDHDFVGLHTGSSINQQLAQASLAAQRTLRLRIQVTSYDALARMVEAGLGVGVMPKAVRAAAGRSLGIVVVPLTDAWAKRQLSICVRSYESLPVAARLLVDSLRSS
jgi:DNA-binding transcriptional LysR family regulator